jgi:hypothetical protein
MRHHCLSKTRTRFIQTLVLTLLWAMPASGGVAQFWKYRGIHPVSPLSGEFCYIDVVHVHPIQPPDMRLYVVVNQQEHLFVGDPATLGYDGVRYAYYGPHPLVAPGLPAAAPKIYCYISGPHYHAEQPPDSPAFVLKNGAYWFVGEPGPEFERERHRTWINETHAIKSYRPPNVDIAAAPPAYHPLVLPEKPEAVPALPTVSPRGKKSPARATGSR